MSAALAGAPVAVEPVRLVAEALAHRYGVRPGLRPVSFEVTGPAVVAVTGANGSGKSTLLRILAGLLRPSAGRVTMHVNGEALQPGAWRGAIGLASPELHFYEELSGEENLRFAAEARALREPAAAVTAALARVGLAGRGPDRVSALSSGMKQRLRIAFAMLHRPRVLMLDEPGSHLDEEGRAGLAELVADFAREVLVLVATNEEREASLAERRIELRGGGLGDPA